MFCTRKDKGNASIQFEYIDYLSLSSSFLCDLNKLNVSKCNELYLLANDSLMGILFV